MPRRFSRYSRYTGGPDPLAPPVDVTAALREIGDDVMGGASASTALRELLRRGLGDRDGLDALRRDVLRRRRERLADANLEGTFDEIKKLLDEAVLTERKRLARDLDDAARFAEFTLAELSPSTAAAVTELTDYRWRSPEAAATYAKIGELMGRELLDQRFAGMKQALEGATDADRAEIAQMLADLRDLVAKHNRGEASEQDFDEFMTRHGHHFPEQPQTLDELIDALARRAAAAQAFRNSLTPEQRAELDQLAQQAFGSDGLMSALAGLDAELRQARPGFDWGRSESADGQAAMSMGEVTAALADVADLDALAEQLSQQYPGASLADVDLDALARQLGPEAARRASDLARLDRELRERGLLDRAPDGALRLSPAAMRRLGETILRDIAAELGGGERLSSRAGASAEPTGASRPWRFGDTEPWDVTRTVGNAVARVAATGADASRGVRLQVDDVVVAETEARSKAAVALLVDTSFSMLVEGRWVPMKRTALALNHLVQTRFRSDELALIGFGRDAQRYDADELAALDHDGTQGTNLHHALLLAGRHLRRHPGTTPVVLIVTDGEPTAHREPDGESIFWYPPLRETIAATIRELDDLARLGARITFFRLGDEPALARFLDAVARRVGGRVVAPTLDGLGAAVVGDYLRR